MELKFVLGKSGKSKTEYCVNEMLKLPKTKKVIYIVPEQFTLESERILTRRRKSLLNIDVVSFRRLYFHITAQVGKPNKEFLDDEGKNMILRRLLEEIKPKFFSRSQGKPGFLDSLESIIGEFYRFRLTPDMLRENIGKIEETPENTDFIKKLREITEIYSAYDSYVSERYISSDGILDFVAAKIRETNLFENCDVFIDGFNSFTAQEYAVISEIFAYADNVALTLCLEKPVEKFTEDALSDPFYETKTAYVRLCGIYRELYPIDGSIKNIITEREEKPLPVLDFLEKSFFEFNVPVYGETDDVRAFSAVNKKAEVSVLCREICRLVKEGIRYKDMGIILCDPSYAPILKAGLKSRDIPDFSDSRAPLISHPLARFMLSLINIAAYTYQTQDVFTFLKTGYTSIEPYKVDRLEKYALEYGITGYKWETEIKNSDYFEKIRQSFVNMVSPLRKFSPKKAYPLSELNKALFEAVSLSGFEKNYLKIIKETADEVTASKYKQFWEQAVDTFNKADEFLGDSEVTLEEYGNIISSGFEKKTAATIPLYQDIILIGDVERSRLPELKVLFIIGANKEKLPRKFEDTGLISDRERAVMKANGMEIAADTKEQLSLEYLKIYQIITKPSKRLYISWSAGTNAGDKLEKSEIADKIVKMFKIKPEIYSEEAVSPQNKEIFLPSDNISSEITAALTGETLTLSSSKLDKYVKCPFSYYLRYVLGLEEERIFEINAVDRGNILHGIMEKFFKETENIYDMTAEEINRRINEIMPEVLAENLANIAEDGKIPENLPLLKYSVNRIEKTADTSVLAGLNQLKQGKFVPAEFEVSFGSRKEDSLPPVKISDDVNLVGKIDRVDIYEEGDNVYVKITDYKSSVQTLDMTEIYNGLKLQLLLYLSAYTEEKQKAAEENETYHPAGLMYFSFSDPILKESEISGKGKTVENVKLGKFKPVGIFSDEAQDALGMESAKSRSKNTDIIAEDEFKKIMDRAKKISAETGEKIKKGIFPVKPYIYSGRKGCDYCPYSGICEINTDESRANVIKNIDIE